MRALVLYILFFIFSVSNGVAQLTVNYGIIQDEYQDVESFAECSISEEGYSWSLPLRNGFRLLFDFLEDYPDINRKSLVQAHKYIASPYGPDLECLGFRGKIQGKGKKKYAIVEATFRFGDDMIYIDGDIPLLYCSNTQSNED